MNDGLKTKQSEDQLLASSTVYAKCYNHPLLFYQTPPPTWLSRPSPYIMSAYSKAICLTEATSTLFLNRSTVSLRFLAWHLSLSLPLSVWPRLTPRVPLRIHKTVSNEIHINVCVSVCFLSLSLSRAACSKPLSPTGVFSQFTSSDSCIRSGF